MRHETTIMEIMEKLVIASKHEVAELMAYRGFWTPGPSATNNTYKYQMVLVQLKRLVKGNGFFKLPGCESEYKEHAQLLTKTLIQILKANPEAAIWRERPIPEVGSRPDALVLLRKGNLGRMLILEACDSETDSYLRAKINLYRKNPEIPRLLGEITGVRIPSFDIVIVGRDAPQGTITLNTALEDL